MKKLLISLGIALFIFTGALSQARVFNSTGYVLVVEDVKKTVTANTTITFDRGFVRLDPEGGDENDHTNMLINKDGGTETETNTIISFFHAVDKDCSEIVIAITYFINEDQTAVGFVSDNYVIYYRGAFED